ncbi:hypothetical protein CRE_21537 [Caenorhabditis remanei]|uniref:Uncharacterized protein n=1 Tax=Caenorhabditis remanei TaxID=31234 RepID=E3NCQ7_CAERE|nr:hypothetical protein CRE_21537 [Caenorhabditis remanei]
MADHKEPNFAEAVVGNLPLNKPVETMTTTELLLYTLFGDDNKTEEAKTVGRTAEYLEVHMAPNNSVIVSSNLQDMTDFKWIANCVVVNFEGQEIYKETPGITSEVEFVTHCFEVLHCRTVKIFLQDEVSGDAVKEMFSNFEIYSINTQTFAQLEQLLLLYVPPIMEIGLQVYPPADSTIPFPSDTDIVEKQQRYEGDIPVRLGHLLTDRYKVIDVNTPVLKNYQELVSILSSLWNGRSLKDDLCIRFYHTHSSQSHSQYRSLTLHTVLHPIMYWYDRYAPRGLAKRPQCDYEDGILLLKIPMKISCEEEEKPTRK